jgi:hypothetical protein
MFASEQVSFLGAALQTIREGLLLLSKLMEGWLRLLQEQRLASSSLCTAAGSNSSSLSRSSGRIEQQQRSYDASKPEPASKEAAAGQATASSSSSSGSLGLDVHRLEGVLFMLLCSYDESIRGDALTLLGLTRLLHQELQSLAQQMNIRLGAPPQQQQQQQQAGAGAAGAGAGASNSSNALAGLSSSFTSVTSSLATAGVQDSVASLSHAAGGGAAVAASGGSGSGGGFFFRHKPTMSRDSFEFMQTLGGCSSRLDLLAAISCCISALDMLLLDCWVAGQVQQAGFSSMHAVCMSDVPSVSVSLRYPGQLETPDAGVTYTMGVLSCMSHTCFVCSSSLSCTFQASWRLLMQVSRTSWMCLRRWGQMLLGAASGTLGTGQTCGGTPSTSLWMCPCR